MENTPKQDGRKRKRRKYSSCGAKKRLQEKDLSLVFTDGHDTFWEVDKILNRRERKGRVEYLVKWVGVSMSEATWEPPANLCDTALEEAEQFDKAYFSKLMSSATLKSTAILEVAEAEGPALLAGDEDKKIGYPQPSQETNHVKTAALQSTNDYASRDVGELVSESGSAAIKPQGPQRRRRHSRKKTRSSPKLQDGRWYWTDEEQIKLRTVERINVNDPDVRERVTDARLNGTPVVLVGHTGWANFAKSWLTMDENMDENGSTEAGENDDDENGEASWLDLSKKYTLDINKMIDHIGDEIVPVVQRDYNEENPLTAKMKASTFLKSCWPDKDGTYRSDERHYLHQWQFPLNPSIGKKLCHNCRILPNNILGEDLLKYWLDLPQCKSDSPLQYIFMGRDETVSKLHRDNGGLAISIAPIVGVKECVLVHRSDGETCFYHLDASLDNIDLHRHPLMSQARIWKTCVEPGEILLMPQGTYHQCRNVSPCLSYSRFHLDTVNLLPFLQSLFDGDAKELDHAEILWNSSTELMSQIDDFSKICRDCKEATPPNPQPSLPDAIIEKVNTLRSLRHICREIAKRLKKRTKLKNVYTAQDWKEMVSDIDHSLKEFRRRASLNPPTRDKMDISTDTTPRETSSAVDHVPPGKGGVNTELMMVQASSKVTEVDHAPSDNVVVSDNTVVVEAASEVDRIPCDNVGVNTDGTVLEASPKLDHIPLDKESVITDPMIVEG